MLGLLTAMAAASLGAPLELTNEAGLLDGDDYPAQAIRDNVQGRTRVRVTVDAEGRLFRCEVVDTSKSAALDTKTCILFRKRAKFKPAKDLNGESITGQAFYSINWIMPRLPDNRPWKLQPDIAFTVAKLPDALTHVLMNVGVLIDDQGAPIHCEVFGPSEIAAINKIACPTVLSKVKFLPALDMQGRPVRTMQTLKVAFVTGNFENEPVRADSRRH